MIDWLRRGLEEIHDDGKRRKFLLEAGGRLGEIDSWLRKSELAEMVDVGYAPTFLHGGSSRARWIIMGINPGADDQTEEHRFKRESAQNFLDFHESFFERFPALRRNGKQAWWAKAYRVSRIFGGVVASSAPVPWRQLQGSPTFVVQDLIPFHGRRSRTLRAREFQRGLLRDLAESAFHGIAQSEARGVLVCSPLGFAICREQRHVRLGREFELAGETKTGKPRRIKGYLGHIGAVPLIALDNEFISQPNFPYERALPQLLRELRAENLIVDPTGPSRAFLAAD